jgi:hypothetical protein
MAKRASGLRFEISINGRKSCTSGMDGYGVLDVILSRVKRDPAAYPGKPERPGDAARSKAAWSRERIDVSVGGLDTASEEHLHWLRRGLRVGDRVSIRLLPPGRYDRAKGRRRRP